MKRLSSKIFLIDIDMFFSSTKPMKDSSGMTLVMLAAAGGQDDLLRLLIRKGAKVNGRQKNGTTALIHAAEKNFLTTVAILLEAGAFVNVQQSNGETALMKVNTSLRF